MKNKDLWIIAYIYSIICFGVYYFQESSKLSKVKSELYQAKSLAVEYHEISESLYHSVDSLNHRMDKMLRMEKLVDDLDRVPRDKQKLSLANCFNESNLNYNVVHKGKFDKTTTGICGVKTEWLSVIPELNEDNINSLYGGYLVLSYLIDKEGDLEKALMKYKGSIKNDKPVKHTLELKRVINL